MALSANQIMAKGDVVNQIPTRTAFIRDRSKVTELDKNHPK